MTDTSLPPVTDTPDVSLRKYSALTFKERWQIFYKRSQYVNEKNLSKAEAENLARADFGVEALSDVEAQKLAEPGIVAKVVDNKAFQAVGLSALLHKNLDWVNAQATAKTENVRGAVTEKVENTQASVTEKIQDANTTTRDRAQDLKTKTFAKAEEVKEKLFAKIPFLHHAEANLEPIPEESKTDSVLSTNSVSSANQVIPNEKEKETLAL